jgi:hypothetical protein
MYRRIPEVKLPQSPSIKIINKNDKENNENQPWYLDTAVGCFDPNNIANSPPNHFLSDLKKRIETYR